MEEARGAFKILTGKPKRKRHLGRPKRTLEENIRMDLKQIGMNRRTGLIWLWTGIKWVLR